MWSHVAEEHTARQNPRWSSSARKVGGWPWSVWTASGMPNGQRAVCRRWCSRPGRVPRVPDGRPCRLSWPVSPHGRGERPFHPERAARDGHRQVVIHAASQMIGAIQQKRMLRVEQSTGQLGLHGSVRSRYARPGSVSWSAENFFPVPGAGKFRRISCEGTDRDVLFRADEV